MRTFFKVSLLLILMCQIANAAENHAIDNQKYCFSVTKLDRFLFDASSPDGAGIKFFTNDACLQSDINCDYISVFAEYMTSGDGLSDGDDYVELFSAKGWQVEHNSNRDINGVVWRECILTNPANMSSALIYSFESKHNSPTIGYHVIAESRNGCAVKDGVEKVLTSFAYVDPCK